MTLAEKISQMQNDAPAIPRLHIAEYDWWNEGLHGVARSGYATVFPQAIGLAATWDTELIHRVADTISTEARAKYNQAQQEKNSFHLLRPHSLVSQYQHRSRSPLGPRPGDLRRRPLPHRPDRLCLCPRPPGHRPANISRRPPLPSTSPSTAARSPSATPSMSPSRPTTSRTPTCPPFANSWSDAHAASVMCAYNSVDGSPACASPMLLQQKLKRDWSFTGYIVSDCAAITDVAAGHKFAPDLAHGAALSLKAGTDLSCGKEYAALNDAVHLGLITKADIDAAVKRLFTARFRLGMFDPPSRVPYNAIPFSENDSAPHSALSLETARASMVLLKNDRSTLPLNPAIKSIAVIGPNAAALAALEGNYNAIASHPISAPRRSPTAHAWTYPLRTRLALRRRSCRARARHRLLLDHRRSQQARTKGRILQRHRIRQHSRLHIASTAPSTSTGTAPPQPAVSPAKLFPCAGPASSPRSPQAPSASTSLWRIAAPARTSNQSESGWTASRSMSSRMQRTHGRRAPTTPFTLTFTDTAPHALRIEYTHDAPHFGAGLTFNWIPPVAGLRHQAIEAAAKSDAIVAFLGLSPDLEGEEMPVHVKGFEGGDRTAIELPDAQLQLVDALASTGKPLVIVLMNGGALALGSAERKAAAILEAWYPGQAGGTAIADTLFGANNPSGRLPVTFYAATSDLPPFDDYSMKGRTYRYFSGKPLYPFGYGLSYTSFQYTSGKLSTTKLQAGAR